MSFIETIEIKNFKSIRHQKIEGCKKINVFIGAPNVGKSNILEAVGLFSISSFPEVDVFKFDDVCRVKHFSELFFNQNYRELGKITLNNNFEIAIELSDTNTMDLQFWGLNPEKLNIQKDFNVFKKISIQQHEMILKEKRSNLIVPSKEMDFRIPKFPIKKYTFLDDLILGNAKSISLNMPYGNNLLEVLQREPKLRKDLTDILNQYKLKLLLDTISNSIMLVKETEEGSVLRIPYHQIADTLKRLIFYKAAILSNKDSVLIFEEPEAHMFPPYISKFAGDMVYDENNNQFFITTHSPFVLNDLLDNAETDDLAIYVVSYKMETGETIISRMSDLDKREAYQFGYDFFMNINQFIPQETNG